MCLRLLLLLLAPVFVFANCELSGAAEECSDRGKDGGGRPYGESVLLRPSFREYFVFALWRKGEEEKEREREMVERLSSGLFNYADFCHPCRARSAVVSKRSGSGRTRIVSDVRFSKSPDACVCGVCM